jgi:chemotaxis regulatin CheY-phosphate phosphatase CheZ
MEVIHMATIHKEVKAFLDDNGRSTTGEMSNELGYTTRQVRKACKDLLADDEIEGSKSKRIPAYIIDDDYVVVTESREQLLELVKQYQPGALSRAKTMSTNELQNFVRSTIADDVVGGPEIWEFWR